MSVRENLTLGRPRRHRRRGPRRRLEVAQAKFVYDLPWGLDTRIGEQGLSLSGGQRQRLALARAVLVAGRASWCSTTRCPRSTCTPRRWSRRRCAGCCADATGIVVAHRASTVLLADKVALLQDGTITHVGDHHELLATVPAYRELLAADAELEEVRA